MSEKLNPEAYDSVYDTLRAVADEVRARLGNGMKTPHWLAIMHPRMRAVLALAESGATEKEPPADEVGAGIFCEWRVYPNGYASPPWYLCNAVGFKDPNRDVVKFCNGCGKHIKWKGAE